MFSGESIVIASLGDMVISALTYIPELSLRVLGISKNMCNCGIWALLIVSSPLVIE